jgi:UDP-hydrolysing UDP-N-acetyl-D-glucosamine 2-epimerase
MQAIQNRPELTLQVIAAGSMVLERFGLPVTLVRQHGFPVDGEIYIELEGSTPASMAKSVGFGVIEFASELQRLRPDVVLLIGDRYEAFAAAIAAVYMNTCVAHIQGGEVSGSIDESARHAISKLAHYHFPSTRRSAEYLIRMGEPPENVLAIGCPSSDLARTLDMTLTSDDVNSQGSGAFIDVDNPYLLAVYHPTTTEYGGEAAQMEALLGALGELAMPTILLWPNIDAGADHISKVIRVFRSGGDTPWLRTITNLSPDVYLRVLFSAACAVGNSSSFVRDAGFAGTPVVLAGNRQNGREADRNVMFVPPHRRQIVEALKLQLQHGRYAPSSLYGDGYVSERIAAALVNLRPFVQKSLAYVQENTLSAVASH